ncbi:putative ripening-related protein 1 [Acorus calamus]|uniref:Ripening-related protein 1 n=1 Tax=Acorus calamus TaxID=4465 RepID=A0AAV9C2V2_ACOCL|nr:putative ripening-related protein 1 [Acorus calamus]
MAKTSSRTAATLVLLLAILNTGIANITSSNGKCHVSGYLRGKSHSCNRHNDSDCCKSGKMYPQYRCSPPITGASTAATMTINCFAENCDGGGPSECDGQYHGDDEMVVALSTGCRCSKYIKISANGKTVRAKVVDECDSVNGCDADHDYQPPCPNNVVDASPAVWNALDIHGSDVGEYHVTWSDA